MFSGQGLSEGVTIGHQLLVQLTGVTAVVLYTAFATWLLLKLVAMITPLRVSEEDETDGLDVALHNESGYDF